MSNPKPLPRYAPPAFAGRFGLARRDITPPAGIHARNWGASERNTAQGVHQPLTLTVLTVERGGGAPAMVLVSADLGWWRAADEEQVLRNALERAGVVPDQGVIALSHTHSGPVFSPGLKDEEGGGLIPGYLDFLCEALIEAVGEAFADAADGLWETTVGTCPLAQNRDLPDPGADAEKPHFLVGWNPSGTPDQTLVCGRISSPQGVLRAVIVNYACHPTILAWENADISPDYIGAMRAVVEQEVDAPCLFLQGASGDLAPRYQYVGDKEVAERAGRCLGYSVLALLSHLPRPGCELVFRGPVESGAPLAIWREERRAENSSEAVASVIVQQLPVREDLPTTTELLAEYEQCTERAFRERLKRKLHVRRSVGEGTHYPVRYLLWRFGGFLFIAIPNEVYSDLQVQVREAATGLPVYLVTLANSGRGYLAPKATYEQDLYAMWQSPFAAGSWEMCRDALCQEVKRLLPCD